MKEDYSTFFAPIENVRPYFKMAAHGIAGSGKTYTLARVAGGLHKEIKSTKPIVIFDTEKSSKFLKPFFEQYKIPVLVRTSRSLTDLTHTMDFCRSGGADILLIDSITHVWENFLKAFKEKKGRSFIQFQDWGVLKPLWKTSFSDRIVDDPYHIFFTGRQGDTYDTTTDDDGKDSLVKTGVKMKAETDTAYEPDVLVMMERVQEFGENPGDPMVVYRRATIMKDRSTLTDGKTFRNPSFKDFKPVIDFLLQGSPVGFVQSTAGDDKDLIRTEEDNREEKARAVIWSERVNSLLDRYAGGTKKEDKSNRVELQQLAYHGETSETAISKMSAAQHEDAYNRLKNKLEPVSYEPETPDFKEPTQSKARTATTDTKAAPNTPEPAKAAPQAVSVPMVGDLRDKVSAFLTPEQRTEWSDGNLIELYTPTGLAEAYAELSELAKNHRVNV